MFGPGPYTCNLSHLRLLCFSQSIYDDAGSFKEIDPAASRRRSLDLFVIFSQIAPWSLRSPLSFYDWFNLIRISRVLNIWFPSSVSGNDNRRYSSSLATKGVGHLARKGTGGRSSVRYIIFFSYKGFGSQRNAVKTNCVRIMHDYMFV